jgi:hypothetical protein
VHESYNSGRYVETILQNPDINLFLSFGGGAGIFKVPEKDSGKI